MKKILALCLCLLLLLSACGSKAPEATVPNDTAADSNQTQAADSDATTPDTSADTTAPEESTGSAADEQKKLAESCIDKSVEELYNLIGEPQSSDYAPSCNGGDGAEDGNLYYDGFIVYTLKEGDSETVVFVE